jgi:3-hydroxyacyl-CoA dehydrogenase
MTLSPNDRRGVSENGVTVIGRISGMPSIASLRAVRRTVEAIGHDDQVRALVLAIDAGPAADWPMEPATPELLAELRELAAMLENSATPSVAAIESGAMAEALELALGCQVRVARRTACFGLPQVAQGLVPGGGGTARLPRLIGAAESIRFAVSGKVIDADDAQAVGLLDGVCDDDVLACTVEAVGHFLRGGGASGLLAGRSHRASEASSVAAIVAAVTRRARGLQAPTACAQLMAEACGGGLGDALAREDATYRNLLGGDPFRIATHVRQAERDAGTIAGVTASTAARSVERIAVIGAGTMGGGIAMSFANAGFPVIVLDLDEKAARAGLARIESTYEMSVARGSLSAAKKAERMALISAVSDYGALRDCDMIVEAVFEGMAIKKEVFARLDGVAKPGAILATNTSFLDVDEIASVTGRPQSVVGTHFFSPANVMKLLEIVRGRETAPDVLATVAGIGRRIGKVPVVVGVCYGFVGNRMLLSRVEEAESLLLEGATPSQIDAVFTDFGWPMGPFQMEDLAGIDVGWRNRQAFGGEAPIADALSVQGRNGQKTGRGFYLYDPATRAAQVDAEVDALVERVSRERGITRRPVTSQEIMERTHYPMINEGTKILEEGIAARASDIDVVWNHGYGFPASKGGPMFWAEAVGLPLIVERLDHWHQKTGKDVFIVSPLLRRLAREGRGFAAA